MRKNKERIFMSWLTIVCIFVVCIGINEQFNAIQQTQKEILSELKLMNEKPMLSSISKPREIVEQEEPVEAVASYLDVNACSTDAIFKSYMDYRMITNPDSKQYKLQQEAYTGADGIRYVGDRLMLAIAGYAVGTEIDITLADGDVLYGIIGDVKADTDCVHPDGSIIEFIVDTDQMDSYVKTMGSYDSIYDGPILNLRVHI